MPLLPPPPLSLPLTAASSSPFSLSSFFGARDEKLSLGCAKQRSIEQITHTLFSPSCQSASLEEPTFSKSTKSDAYLLVCHLHFRCPEILVSQLRDCFESQKRLGLYTPLRLQNCICGICYGRSITFGWSSLMTQGTQYHNFLVNTFRLKRRWLLIMSFFFFLTYWLF